MGRNINDYMNQYDGRKVSDTQFYGVVEWQQLSHKLERMRDQKQTLQRAGLDVEAKRVQQAINEVEHQRRDLEDRLNEERRSLNRILLLVLAVCDIATVSADKFAAGLHKLSRGLYGLDNSFSAQVRDMANQFNKLVRVIDEGGNYALSMHYAEMSDGITDTAIELILSRIDEVMNSPQGKKYY